MVELSLDRTMGADRAIADLNTRAFDKLGIAISTDTIDTNLANQKPVRIACLEGHIAVLEPKK